MKPSSTNNGFVAAHAASAFCGYRIFSYIYPPLIRKKRYKNLRMDEATNARNGNELELWMMYHLNHAKI